MDGSPRFQYYQFPSCRVVENLFRSQNWTTEPSTTATATSSLSSPWSQRQEDLLLDAWILNIPVKLLQPQFGKSIGQIQYKLGTLRKEWYSLDAASQLTRKATATANAAIPSSPLYHISQKYNKDQESRAVAWSQAERAYAEKMVLAGNEASIHFPNRTRARTAKLIKSIRAKLAKLDSDTQRQLRS